MREIILDTETTGLDPASGHRIVEIGAVEMINKSRTGKTFHTYLNPERDMPPEAEKVHGLSQAFLSDKPLFKSVAEEFLEFLSDSTLVIHNAAFDMKFINHELERHARAIIPMERALDTVLLARRKFPGSPANLDALCRRFNIDLSGRNYHGALLDAELLAEVYIELCGGRQVMLSFGETAADTPSENLPGKHGRASIPKRHFPPSEAEFAAHQNLIAQLKESLWQKEYAD